MLKERYENHIGCNNVFPRIGSSHRVLCFCLICENCSRSGGEGCGCQKSPFSYDAAHRYLQITVCGGDQGRFGGETPRRDREESRRSLDIGSEIYDTDGCQDRFPQARSQGICGSETGRGPQSARRSRRRKGTGIDGLPAGSGKAVREIGDLETAATETRRNSRSGRSSKRL